MRSVSATTIILAALFIGPTLPPPVQAQELSPQQQEVWKNVQAYNELYKQGDLEGFLSYFHPEYRGWFYLDQAPSGKDNLKEWISHAFKTSPTLVSEVHPLAILIHDDVAIVHYVYSSLYKNAEGAEERSSGRWTDVLKKHAGKWILIADHGGPSSPSR